LVSEEEHGGGLCAGPNWCGGHGGGVLPQGKLAWAGRTWANAGFIVAPDWRNRGLGWLLGTTMLASAKQLGYRSVIFNLVFSDNAVARHLWDKLGFKELGAIPGAVRKNDGIYQDAVIMF
jgi:ribosomal protein S18 acetylase RimI-like enzyme